MTSATVARIGITGAPGAGTSSLTDRLVTVLRSPTFDQYRAAEQLVAESFGAASP